MQRKIIGGEHLKVKTIHLSGWYPQDTVSVLDKRDYRNFSNLLNGENCDNDVLFITPLVLNYIYSCRGFRIEHHQVFYSLGNNRYYLVFRAVPIFGSCNYFDMFLHYQCISSLSENQLLSARGSHLTVGLKRLCLPTYDNGESYPYRKQLILPSRL